MHKRRFLQAVACAAPLATALPHAQAAKPAAPAPVLLTVTGQVSKPNRGPLNKVVDQMMGKHGIAFDKARALTFSDVLALPATEIRPTLEYDGQRHTLRGPLLTRVLEAAGAPTADTLRVGMRAVDGYNAELSLGELRRLGFIVATHLDGQPMALGGLGPLWAVYEPDRFPELASKPLPERFAGCPWGVYAIHAG